MSPKSWRAAARSYQAFWCDVCVRSTAPLSRTNRRLRLREYLRFVLLRIPGRPGGLLRAVLQRNTSLRGLLFDQELVLRDHLLAAADLAGRWKVESGDFYEDVPEGADFYILKQILHDWNDEDCLRILGSCRRAMTADSVLLVVDSVLPPGNEPHPAKAVDIMMMTMLNGRERTVADFVALLGSAGFTTERIISTAASTSIIEAGFS